MNKSYLRRQAGETANAEGTAWEKSLEHAHKAYEHAGIALIEKKPTPTSPAPGQRGRSGPKLLIYAARSSYDYHGVLGHDTEPGQAIAMEAKHSSDPKPSMKVVLDGKQSGLQWHQLEALHKALKFNALATVVWANGIRKPDGARLVLLPDKLNEAYHRAKALRGRQKTTTIPRDQFTPFEPGRVGGVFVDDWLWPVVEWMREHRSEDAA